MNYSGFRIFSSIIFTRSSIFHRVIVVLNHIQAFIVPKVDRKEVGNRL